MANSYDEILKKYVNAPYSTLLSIANESLSIVMPVFNGVAKDGNGAGLVLPFICTAIASDGKFSELEYRFIKDVTGVNKSYNEFKQIIQEYYTDEWIEAVDNLIDKCPDEMKIHLVSFCLTFVAVDETITREENAYIAKLLS